MHGRLAFTVDVERARRAPCSKWLFIAVVYLDLLFLQRMIENVVERVAIVNVVMPYNFHVPGLHDRPVFVDQLGHSTEFSGLYLAYNSSKIVNHKGSPCAKSGDKMKLSPLTPHGHTPMQLQRCKPNR